MFFFASDRARVGGYIYIYIDPSFSKALRGLLAHRPEADQLLGILGEGLNVASPVFNGDEGLPPKGSFFFQGRVFVKFRVWVYIYRHIY